MQMQKRKVIEAHDVGPINWGRAWLDCESGLILKADVVHVFSAAKQIRSYTHFLGVLARSGQLDSPSEYDVVAVVIEDQVVMRRKPSVIKWEDISMEFVLNFYHQLKGKKVVTVSPKAYKKHFNALHDNKRTKTKMQAAAHAFFSAEFEEEYDSHMPNSDKPHVADACGLARFYWEKEFKV